MRRALVLLLTFLTVGCGYSFRALDPSFRTVFVAPVKNNIKLEGDYSSLEDIKKYYPNLEIFVRQKLIERFLVEAGLKLVETPSADISVNLSLVDYVKEPVGYEGDDEVKRWRIRIGADLKVRLGDKEISRRIYGESIYDPAVEGERFAVRSAIEDLARRISDAVLNAW